MAQEIILGKIESNGSSTRKCKNCKEICPPLLLLLRHVAGQSVDSSGGILWCGFQEYKSTG